MGSKETCQCTHGIWRTTKESWVLDWVGSPPPGIRMGQDLKNACDIHRGMPGSTFFDYKKILMLFARKEIENWELVRPNTMIKGKQAWEHVLENIKPRQSTLGSQALGKL